MTQFNRIFLGGQLHHAVQITVSETWPCLWNVGLQHLNRMVSPQILLKQNYITIQFSISKMSLCSWLRQRFTTNIFCIQWPAPSSLGQHYPWLYQLKQAEIFVIKRNNNLFTFMRSSFLCKKKIFQLVWYYLTSKAASIVLLMLLTSDEDLPLMLWCNNLQLDRFCNHLIVLHLWYGYLIKCH